MPRFTACCDCTYSTYAAPPGDVLLAQKNNTLSSLMEKQRMLFYTCNVRSFDLQLKRMISFADKPDVKSMMAEQEIVERESGTSPI